MYPCNVEVRSFLLHFKESDTVKKVFNFIEQLKANSTNTIVQKNGTMLLGYDKSRSPDARHIIYKPLSSREEKKLQSSYRRKIPDELLEFYSITDGIDLFSFSCLYEGILIPCWSIIIYGLPRSFSRSLDRTEPISIAIEDCRRADDCPDSWLFFGGYGSDSQIQVFFDTDEIHNGICPVHACEVDTTHIIKTWPSFENWFLTEAARFQKLFEENGDHIELSSVFPY